MRQQVIRMLKWSNEYGKIYAATVTPGLNVDYLYLKTPFLYELAGDDTSANGAARDLKSQGRFLEQNTLAGQGGRDGIKPDGAGFHHQAHHVTYMHAFNTWIDCAHAVKGTSFKVSSTAYNNMSGAIRALMLETSKGTIFPNSDCGRTPFQSSIPVDSGEFIKLVEVGGDALGFGANPDPAMAAVYNYIYGVNHYGVSPADMDGYYAFNYAQLGVFRKNGWMAAMRGFTDRLFGAEIYPTENRYGRYQSYGALEVLYGGSLTVTGYKKSGDGWDWNVVPGATTVYLSNANLNPLPDKTEEHQLGSFAGGLALGRDGVFGMDFRQDTVTANYTGSGLHFRKSVLAFDTLLVSLGSGIGVTAGSNRVETNLFQASVDSVSTNPTIYIGSSSPVTGTMNTTYATDTSLWVVNGQKTGFFVAKGNDSLTIFRGLQSTPDQEDPTGVALHSANASKAWVNHGNSPTAARYQYVTVPNTTPANMQTLASQLAQGNVYKVLAQTDTVHAVRYLPFHLDAYVFFQPLSNANIGYVKNISAPALLGARESGDTLTLTIASPNLNAVTDAVSYWHSTASSVSVTVKGTWNVAANATGAVISLAGDSLTAGFTLQDGFPATVVLVRQGADPSQPGVWTSPADSNWVYYCNNTSRQQTYLRGVTTYTVLPRTYHVWANNTQQNYLGAAGFPANELATDTVINAFMVEGKNCASLVSGVQTPDNSAQLTIGHSIQVNFGVSNPADGASMAGKTDTLYSLKLNTDTAGSGVVKAKLIPNPASDQLEVLYYSPSTGKAVLYIVNMSGQVVLAKEVWINAGSNTIPLQTAALSRDVYTVVIRMGSSRQELRLLKY